GRSLTAEVSRGPECHLGRGTSLPPRSSCVAGCTFVAARAEACGEAGDVDTRGARAAGNGRLAVARAGRATAAPGSGGRSGPTEGTVYRSGRRGLPAVLRRIRLPGHRRHLLLPEPQPVVQPAGLPGAD